MEVSLKTRGVKETNSHRPAQRHQPGAGAAGVPTLAGPSASAIGDISQCVAVTMCCSHAEPGAALGGNTAM